MDRNPAFAKVEEIEIPTDWDDDDDDEKKIGKSRVTVIERPDEFGNNDDEPKVQLNSKYIEVRSAVEIDDDVSLPAETFRAYIIGILLTIICSSVNNITTLRENELV